MEHPAEAAGPAQRTFSQVVFTNTPHIYPPATTVTCCFTLNASFQPSPRDWVGIFKVGWSTTKDYHTFVWVEPSVDVEGQKSLTRQAVFKDYYLPKDEDDYQFCYIDSNGQVRGASTPFCFRNTTDMSLEVIPDDDLLVITTQEQVDQNVREKAELQRELTQKMEENETLKVSLQLVQQEAAKLKEQQEEQKKEMSRLVKELDQAKEQNKTGHQGQKENEELKKQAQEKYDRAVLKINQLKAEREDLTGKVDAQSAEVVRLNSKVREQETELLNLKDSVQLLQVDIQSSEKEKEHLSMEVQKLQAITQTLDSVTKESQELRKRLSVLEKPQNCPEEASRSAFRTLEGKLQDTQAKLTAEKEESRVIRRQVESLERDLLEAREQLAKVVYRFDETQRTTSKQELQLNETHEMITEKTTEIEELQNRITLERQQKEELQRENQGLCRDIEVLRTHIADLQAPPPTDSLHSLPTPSPPPRSASNTPEWQPLNIPEQEEHPYETIESIVEPVDEPVLVCRHCQESFPGITSLELEQHEQSHRVCPFCTMICDNMEQSVFEDHVYGHEL